MNYLQPNAARAASAAPESDYMAINFYTVSNHLEEEGWRLISHEYKNLDTPLEMECPEGHYQTQTYREWRKRCVCEKCMAGDPYKVKQNKVPEKSANTTRILALDAATNITGYAVYDNKTLVSFGTFKVKNDVPTTERINIMKKWLQTVIQEWQPDFVGLENIQLQTYGANHNQMQVETYRVLANLQGVLVDTLFEACIDHDLCYSVEWRKLCGVGQGTGRENKKKQAQDKVKQWYDIDCTQDEADAICIGKYFCNVIKTSNWGEDIE